MQDLPKSTDEKNSDPNQKIYFMPTEKKYIMVMDETTGNIKGCFPLKSKNLGTGWIALYQDMIFNIAKWNLPNEQNRVFMALLGKVDFENYLTINQGELAQELDIKQPHISRAIKALRERKIIIEGPRAGLNKTYRFNPYIAHKGADRDNTIADFNSVLKSKGKKSPNKDSR